ncbi:contractile injection system protein, VgrG/Pvc8 family [Sedimentitalea sp.]|uniref:phage late control D family protein n=1 Tax=Sedimentitalea sp. TaxID=2048915 RepID=UPI0032990BFE
MSDLGTAPLLYSARPSIEIDGAAQQSLEGGLMSMTVAEDTNGMANCEATFGNWGSGGRGVDFLYFERDVLDFGKSMLVSMGGGDADAQVFAGRISGLEGRYPKSRPPEILVLAEDRFQDLRQTRRTRVFEDASSEDVIRSIASDHGLIPDLDLDGPTLPALAQINQSDFAFLQAIARGIDAEVWMRGDTLFAHRRSSRDEGEITLTYGRGLQELSLRADLAHQCSKLVIGGWDVGGKEAVASEIGPETLSGESQGDTGSDILSARFGSRVERITHHNPGSATEGDALAKAEYRTRARRFLTGEGVAEGDGRIRVGSTIILRGIGALFNGAYTVTAARHLFEIQTGYQTEFSVERPWIGP